MATIYGFSLKGIKTFKGREGEGCQGDIYYDGKKVGWYSDNADGGMADIDFYGEIEQRKRMSDLLKAATVKYYAQYPLAGEFSSLEPNEEMFMSELVGFTEHEKEFKKYQKDGYIAMAVFRKPGDDLYEYTQLFKRKAAIEEFQKRTDIEQARIYTKDAFVIADEQPLTATKENNDCWYFCAVDIAGNQSPIMFRYIDTIAPVGSVETQDRDIIPNGGATNRPFIYNPTDERVISDVEYKSPSVTTWTAYPGDTSILTSDGWYYFRATDGAGNVSDEYRVYYDTTAPLGCVYDAGGARGSGSITDKSYVKYTASDSGSGVGTVYVKKPGSSAFVSYTNGSQLTAEGKY